MSLHFTVYMSGQSDVGQMRTHNEDTIAWHQEHGLLILADGMGGHNAGDVASKLCVQSLEEDLLEKLGKPLSIKANKNMSQQATLVKRAVAAANRAVSGAASDNTDYQGMGTTLVLLLFYDDKAVLAHVGDSRIYRLRGKTFGQLTEDHSLVQEMLSRGMMSEDEVADSGCGHVVTRAIGVDDAVEADIHEETVQAGDIFLLCSDGLTDLVDDEAIAETLQAASGNWSRACQRLIDLANHNGGSDNVSVLIAAVGGPR